MLSRNTHIFIFLMMFATTAIFWVTDLDMQVTSYFYAPEQSPQHRWPIFENPFWHFFYRSAPVISILIAIGCLLVIFGSLLKKKWTDHRRAAYFVLAVFVVGPGLIVNAIFKDNWGRPRPDQVVEFGGSASYIPPGLYNAEGKGKSFPCGHSSVGFALIAFWFLWRRSRPRLANAFLYGSLILGTILGISRISNGAHFLSDVLWSAWIPILVASVLHHVFYGREIKHTQTKLFGIKEAIYTSLSIATLSGSLLAFPVEKHVSETSILDNNIDTICIIAEDAELTIIHPVDDQDTVTGTGIKINYQGKGFGLIGSKVKFTRNTEGSALIFAFSKTGLYTEWNSKAVLSVPDNSIRQIAIVTKNNNLQLNGNKHSFPSIQQINTRKDKKSGKQTYAERCQLKQA